MGQTWSRISPELHHFLIKGRHKLQWLFKKNIYILNNFYCTYFIVEL